MKRAVQIVLAVLAVVAALAVVRGELDEGASAASKARPVAPGKSAEIQVSKYSAKKKVIGSFRVESTRVYPELTPADEFSDPVGRPGGRVVVAVIDCACPEGEDLMLPNFFVVDADGRRWEGNDIDDPQDFVELKGVTTSEFDIGQGTPYRTVIAFVVPTKRAGEVDVLLEPLVGDARVFRR